MKISVVIPTYEAYGQGVEFLSRAIESVKEQVVVGFDVEIVVSDHSADDTIEKYVSDKDVIYVRNINKIGNSSANLNNAIRHSTGDIIKPLFMDDYLFSEMALFSFVARFKNGASWVVSGNNATDDGESYYNHFIPYWNDNIIFGVNTLSSPSCIAYLRTDVEWDERLIWLMDCKFYQDLYDKWGEPTINRNILVTNRHHNKQLTNTLSNERKEYEEQLIKKEYEYKTND